jgi:uncharacterized membrane protein YuzA (DUF378 family)
MESTTNRQDPARHTAASPRGGKGVLWTIALVLLIVGGINWGLVGLFGIDLVATLFGDMSGLSRVVYVLVGIAALISVFALPRLARAG